MPTYLIVLHDGVQAMPEMSIDLPDLRSAREKAVRALTDAARDELPNDGDRDTLWVSVQDEAGAELLMATLEFRLNSTGRR